MSAARPFGTWDEERVYVLMTLEDLKDEQKRQAEASAADRVALIEKGARDIRAAHEKIRALEGAARTLRLKNWLMGIVIGAGGAVGFELLKYLLHGWKP